MFQICDSAPVGPCDVAAPKRPEEAQRSVSFNRMLVYRLSLLKGGEWDFPQGSVVCVERWDTRVLLRSNGLFGSRFQMLFESGLRGAVT